ncbi:SGNH/GDSL hydrolase family protein [Chroococcidiopsis sp. TS-821]|uniref:SGNH/GDSL hydrolase family protein n=1 Tax=Chroococcidiopsis sp. TS-821 TaxID=1378066 RepID=UPI00143CDE7C|nr:SGNH/GDSL hydrolase family protein [Chroococcidiopsis sp. TS-821]
MSKKILHRLMQYSIFTKVIYLLYYSHVINITIINISLKNKLAQTSYKKNNSFTLTPVKVNISANYIETNSCGDAPANKNAIADLEEKCTFIPEYHAPLKIMLLGDSITHGVKGIDDRDSGGYRPELWQKFIADGLPVKFVGSKTNGPENLGDKTHEGHPGWTIKQIAASIDTWLNTTQPDLILLMLGTNDTSRSSLKTMIEDFSNLLDKITACCPKAQLLVASIPPIHPAAKPAIRSLRGMYFNAAIPSIVSSKKAQGKKLHFVDMQSLSIQDLTSSFSLDLDRGLHPNTQGYHKIASLWHDAVLKVLSDRQANLACLRSQR